MEATVLLATLKPLEMVHSLVLSQRSTESFFESMACFCPDMTCELWDITCTSVCSRHISRIIKANRPQFGASPRSIWIPLANESFQFFIFTKFILNSQNTFSLCHYGLLSIWRKKWQNLNLKLTVHNILSEVTVYRNKWSLPLCVGCERNLIHLDKRLTIKYVCWPFVMYYQYNLAFHSLFVLWEKDLM